VSAILIEQVVPYVLGNSSVFKKGAPEQVDVHEGTWEGFWSMITGGDHQRKKYYPEPHHPSVSLLCKWIFGRTRQTKITNAELNWLYSALIAKKPTTPLTYDQPVVL
jgi:hypothetical protein